MYDQHEMMRDFYYTNQYLEKVTNYPKQKKQINFLGKKHIFYLSNSGSGKWRKLRVGNSRWWIPNLI
jgi:hypothetical protein